MTAVPSSSRLFEATLLQGGVVVTETPKLDIESYSLNYSGRTKFERLFFIGTHSTILSAEALKAAFLEAKKGKDLQHYKSAIENFQLTGQDDPDVVYDTKWIDQVTKKNAAESERLEAELKGYKNNLIKESIRMGNEDLGRHYQAIGDLLKAAEAFGRMRQDVSTQKHIADVGRHLISVFIDQNNWHGVMSNVQKIVQAKGITPEELQVMQPYHTVPSGLANLASGRFKEAAEDFIGTSPGLGVDFNHICTPNDVAIYGGLCALASMDRGKLQARVLESSSFRTYLELEPHIRKAISFFINGRYAACLSILEDYKADFQLDIYLANHVSELYRLIRSKSIVQYFVPFSCVTLDSLNEAFGVPGTSIENELVGMITSGTLVARIDKENKLLVAVPDLPRAQLQAKTLSSAKAYEKEMRHRIQRMNILGAGLEIRATKNNHGASGGGLPGLGDMIGGIGMRSGHGNDSGYD